MAGKGGPKGHKNYNPAGTKDAKAEAYLVLRDHHIKAAKKLCALLDSENEEVVRKSANDVLDRLDGKPKQTVDNSVNGELVTVIKRVVVDGNAKD